MFMKLIPIQPRPAFRTLSAESSDQDVIVQFNPENLSLASLNQQLSQYILISQLQLAFSNPQKNDSNDVYRGRLTFSLQPNISDSSYISQITEKIQQIPEFHGAEEISVIPKEFADLRLTARFKSINYTKLVRQYVRIQSSLFDHNEADVQLSAVINGQRVKKTITVKLPFETTNDTPVSQNNLSLDIFNRLKIDLNEQNFML